MLKKSVCISVFGINKTHHFPWLYPRVPQEEPPGETRLPLLEARGAGRESRTVQILEKQR